MFSDNTVRISSSVILAQNEDPDKQPDDVTIKHGLEIGSVGVIRERTQTGVQNNQLDVENSVGDGDDGLVGVLQDVLQETGTVTVVKEGGENNAPASSKTDSASLCTTVKTTRRKPMKNAFFCGICNRGFKDSSHLKDHLRSHTQEKPYGCELCQRVFGSINGLRNHFITKLHTNLLSKQVQSDRVPQKVNIFNVVQETNTSGMRSPSSENDSSENNNGEVNMLSGSIAAVKPATANGKEKKRYICVICSQEFRNNTHLKDHLRWHTGEKPYVCMTCNKQFTRAGYLKVHMKMHEGLKFYSCNMCTEAFATNCALKYHVRKQHMKDRPFKCTICTKSFLTNQHLQDHSLIHGDIKPHQCTVCFKRFQRKYSLKLHSLIHSGDWVHKCSTCGEHFRTTQILKRHELKHDGKKNFVCKQCAKCFLQQVDLTNHMRTDSHSDHKSHLCERCGTTFARLSNLRSHEMIHANVKRHKCEMCDLSFVEANRLKRHMSVHSTAQPFACGVCNVQVKTQSSLRRHMAKHERKI